MNLERILADVERLSTKQDVIDVHDNLLSNTEGAFQDAHLSYNQRRRLTGELNTLSKYNDIISNYVFSKSSVLPASLATVYARAVGAACGLADLVPAAALSTARMVYLAENTLANSSLSFSSIIPSSIVFIRGAGKLGADLAASAGLSEEKERSRWQRAACAVVSSVAMSGLGSYLVQGLIPSRGMPSLTKIAHLNRYKNKDTYEIDFSGYLEAVGSLSKLARFPLLAPLSHQDGDQRLFEWGATGKIPLESSYDRSLRELTVSWRFRRPDKLICLPKEALPQNLIVQTFLENATIGNVIPSFTIPYFGQLISTFYSFSVWSPALPPPLLARAAGLLVDQSARAIQMVVTATSAPPSCRVADLFVSLLGALVDGIGAITACLSLHHAMPMVLDRWTSLCTEAGTYAGACMGALLTRPTATWLGLARLRLTHPSLAIPEPGVVLPAQLHDVDYGIVSRQFNCWVSHLRKLLSSPQLVQAQTVLAAVSRGLQQELTTHPFDTASAFGRSRFDSAVVYAVAHLELLAS